MTYAALERVLLVMRERNIPPVNDDYLCMVHPRKAVMLRTWMRRTRNERWKRRAYLRRRRGSCPWG